MFFFAARWVGKLMFRALGLVRDKFLCLHEKQEVERVVFRGSMRIPAHQQVYLMLPSYTENGMLSDIGVFGL